MPAAHHHSRSTARGLRLGSALAAALGAALLLGGCFTPKSPGNLMVRSVTDQPVELECAFSQAFFRPADAGTSFYLSDVPLDDLLQGRPRVGQIMHVELMWLPKAGRTPVDATATNVSIRHVVFADGEVGVYGGAGFAWVKGKPEGKKLTLDIEEASMSLLASTPGFQDLLTPSILTGRLTASRDEIMALRYRQAASQIVTDVFGESRYVLGDRTELRMFAAAQAPQQQVCH